MSLHQPRTRLSGTAKAFKREWLDLKDQWRDEKATEFKNRYIEELFDSVDHAVAAIDGLDKIISKIREDCDVETTDY